MAAYDDFFRTQDLIEPLKKRADILHAFHLYVVKIDSEKTGKPKSQIFSQMKQLGIHLNVHYIPVHLHPFYRKQFNTGRGLCPVSEKAYEMIFSVPVYPSMTGEDVKRVCNAFDMVINRRTH